MIVDDLGINTIRIIFDGYIESTNDNDDPDNINLTAFDPETGVHKGAFEFVPKWKKAGITRFFATLFSPPGWMKSNGTVENGGTVPEEYDEEFGEFCAGYAKLFKQHNGIDLWGMTPYVEPGFRQGWASCTFTAPRLAETFRAIGARLEKENMSALKFFAPEHMADYRSMQYLQYLFKDTAATRYLDAVSLHGSNDSLTWSSLVRKCEEYNKPIWHTSTANGWPKLAGWDERGMTVAQSLYRALRFGKITLWTWFVTNTSTRSAEEGGGVTTNGKPNSGYYATKHYSHFARPGAVQIRSASNDTNVLATAFHHPELKTVSIVLINTSTQEKAIQLNDAPGGTYKMYTTSAQDTFALKGEYATNQSVTLPSRSITTLHAQDVPVHTFPNPMVPSNRKNTLQLKGTSRIMIYDIAGRRITSFTINTSDKHSIYWDFRDASGNQVAPSIYYSVITDRSGKQHIGPVFKNIF